MPDISLSIALINPNLVVTPIYSIIGTSFKFASIFANFFNPKHRSRDDIIQLVNYKLSVKVRVMTSRCCSGVNELKRTA